MEARRLQLLIKQRERLENDVRALEEEIMLLVGRSIPTFQSTLRIDAGGRQKEETIRKVIIGRVGSLRSPPPLLPPRPRILIVQ
jgi:hypothetical protein